LLPVLLIGSVSFLDAFGGRARLAAVFPFLEFVGDRNIALLLGAAVAVVLLMRQRRFTLAEVTERISPPFATAGVIILISSAGGAFGFMLRHAGVGEAIQALTAGRGVNLILLSWTVSAVIRIAQGSATVAMITTSSMVYPMINPATLPYHPIYLFLAIGFGSKLLSWMNDSGFWVVSKLSGFTEAETLRSWTVIVSVASVSGLLVTLLGAMIWPGK
jgi:GntP family gluconate:H+ symporter